MWLLSAAPLSFLPSDPTAVLVQQALMELVLAAPDSSLPSLLLGLRSQVSVGACATATPIANAETKATSAIRFMWLSLSRQLLRDVCTNTASCRHNYGRHRMLHRSMLPLCLPDQTCSPC